MSNSLHLSSSSEPSPQSSELSQTQWLEIQRWLAHSNWVDVQNLSTGKTQWVEHHWKNNLSCFPMGKEGDMTIWALCLFFVCVLRKRLGLRKDWPQCVSSAPFSQSFSLSHVQLMGMQRPLGQAKKLTGHLSLFLSARQIIKSNTVK